MTWPLKGILDPTIFQKTPSFPWERQVRVREKPWSVVMTSRRRCARHISMYLGSSFSRTLPRAPGISKENIKYVPLSPTRYYSIVLRKSYIITPMKYQVRIKKRVARGAMKLPKNVQKLLFLLIADLQADGPIQKSWANFFSIGKERYHCHFTLTLQKSRMLQV